MSSSDILASRTLKATPGIKYTGNCGCERRLQFVSTSRSPTRYTINLASAFGSPFTLNGLVGHFRPENSVQDASLTTFAINVGQKTRGVSSPFTQHKTVVAVSAVRAKALDLKFQALNIPPVTPVKVDRLEFLLQGYDPTLKRFLVDGFRYDFRIHFVGERCAYDSPDLKVHYN